MRSPGILFFWFLLVCCQAHSEITLSGSVQGEGGSPLEKAQLQINGVQVETDPDGLFRASLDTQDLYQIRIEKTGFYPAVQTFSHHELGKFRAPFSLPPIVLVERKSERVMMAFGGDVMMGRRYWSPYFGDEVLIDEHNTLADTKAIVAHVKPYLEIADLAALNLETPILKEAPATKAPKSVTFFSPPETLDALKWAGVDYVSLGNNHTYDYEEEGLKKTLAFLDDRQLAFSGAGLTQQQAESPYIAEVQDKHFAMLGYVGWAGNFSPNQVADAQKGGAALGTTEAIMRGVATSKGKGHVPVVQYHGSLEYADEPSVMTEQRLKSAIDAGAALAIAHHPHVAQGFEIYQGKLIAYSLGNFIFDQFFPSTQHSFLLYVWMDGDTFHRAEIVPLYVKGYRPTPATGINRYTLMKRLSTLSAKRGTPLLVSGGHGVITPKAPPQSPSTNTVEIPMESSEIAPLYTLPWEQSLDAVSLSGRGAYRLGRALTNAGDFESYHLFGAAERGWQATATTAEILSEQGNRFMRLSSSEGGAALMMKNFRRVYSPGSPTTVSFNVRVAEKTSLRVSWQGRKTRQKFFDALNHSPWQTIETVELSPGQWQKVKAEFASPRVGYRSIRVKIETMGEAQHIELDDVHLIEWHSAFTQQPLPALLSDNVRQAAFIEYKGPEPALVKLTLTH